MKGNLKYKSSRSDWGNLNSSNRRILAPQKETNRNRFRRLLYRFLFKSLGLLFTFFIIYQVFLTAKESTDSINIGQSISNLMRTSISPPSDFQIYDTKVDIDNYTSFSLPQASQQATIKALINSGDNFSKIFDRYGFSMEDSQKVQLSINEFRNSSSIEFSLKPKELLEIQMNSEGLPMKIVLPLNQGRELLIVKNSAGNYDVSLNEIQKKTGERILFGSIETSFAAAATKSGMSYDLVDDLVDVFSDRVSFHKDFRQGDRFTVIYQEHESVDGNKVSSGPILAAALEINGKNYVAVRFVGSDGKSRYYSESGQILGDSFLRFPLKFSKISSYFTSGRFHPVLKVKRPHNGVDFAAPIGTPVRSVGGGEILFAGRKGGHGIIVEVRHSARFVTGYSHLSSIASGLKKGVKIQRGELIGAVGMTGLATGPHLHFSLYDNGKYVDPLKTDLPRMEESSSKYGMSDRYFKRALFTLEHYQDVVSSDVQTSFNK